MDHKTKSTKRAREFLRKRRTDQTTAQLARRTSQRMVSDWIGVLRDELQRRRDAGLPTDRRKHQPAWLKDDSPAQLVSAESLALLICDAILRPRYGDPDDWTDRLVDPADWTERELPSPLTVAGELGRALGVKGENRHAAKANREETGMDLLGIAEDAGLIGPLQTRGARGTRVQPRVELSPAAQAQLGEIYTRLTLANDGRTDQVLFEPPAPIVEVSPNVLGLSETPTNAAPKVIEALNALQHTAWQVCEPMLDRLTRDKDPVTEVRRAAEALRDARKRLRRLRKAVAITRRDLKQQTQSRRPLKLREQTHTQLGKLLGERETAKKHVDCCLEDQQNWLAITQAAALRGKGPFYFRTRFDYRGRAYTVGGMLNYTGGSDLARSLLEFHDSTKPTDELWVWAGCWLSVHLTAMYGHGEDKKPFIDRLNWAQLQSDKLTSIANGAAPAEALPSAPEKPHRFVAACLAWGRYIAQQPLHTPVVVDATQSGLQHYAWLARDKELGRRVNAYRDLPAANPAISGVQTARMTDPPRDFYQDVAEQTETRFDRDTIKKLTNPQIYGAGLKRQQRILARLLGRSVDDDIKGQARAVRAAVEALAPSFKRISMWLKQCAKLAAERGESITWTLPDGFVCLQDSRETTTEFKARFYLPGRSRELEYTRTQPKETISAEDQARQIAPNYVHSLDGAYLREVVRQSVSAGIGAFATAHDSFATLPGQGLLLYGVLRPAVEALYGTSPLTELHRQWATSGCSLPPEHRETLDGGFCLGDIVS